VTKAEAFARNSGVREIEPDDPLMREIDELLDSPSAHEHRGNQALEGGQLAAAAAEFKRAIELAPGDPSPRQHLGTVMFLSGDVDGAVAQLTEALRIAPTFARAHYSLALVLDSKAQTDDVLRELTAALSSDPSYVAARLARADVLRKQRRWQESLADYRQAFTLDPGSARAILGAAMVLAGLERFADARDRLAEGLVVLPNQPELHHALARLLAAAPDARVRDAHQALLIMRARLAVDARSVELAETMAMVSAEGSQWDDAITWQRQAIAGAERARLAPLAERLRAVLLLYERRVPCRTPWSDQEDLTQLAGLSVE
jgi:tetratricopeptide (TPR) repeat protein